MNKEKYIKVGFPYEFFDETGTETAWVQVKEGEYILDNILFHARGYAWGDIIAVEEKDGCYYIAGLIKSSGHSTIHILFNDEEQREQTIYQLKKKGCDLESFSKKLLIAVDIPPDLHYPDIKRYLENGEKEEKWNYQEACISSVHQESQ